MPVAPAGNWTTPMKTKPLFALPVLLAVLALAGCADESPEQRIAAAKEYLQKKDNKSAVIEIKNALQKNPDSGEARYLLGSTLLAEGNAGAAEVELRKALAAKYAEDAVVPDLARAMLVLGQAKKVIDDYGNTRLDKPAADASLQTTLVAAYAALGKPEEAKKALDAALSADANYAPALLLSARQKAVAKDIDGALAVVQGVINREPGSADAWKLKGDLLLYAKNKPDDALAAYRKALEVDARYGPAYVAILSLLMQQGRFEEATQQLAQLKSFAANHPQTKFLDAELAYHMKDFKRARELSQLLVQQLPNNAQVLQLAGAAELRLGAMAQAEMYLSKATQLAPQLALARRLLIETYLRSGQPVKALAALNAAANKDGDLAPGLYSLAGEVHLQNGDAKTAEAYFARALKLDPDNARKRTAVAITHLAGGQTDSALGELEQIAASGPDVSADLALISAHVRRKEFGKALAAIDKLEAKQPDKPTAANLRGRIQLAQKDNAAARKSFERALAIDPKFFTAAASLAAMDVADNKPDDARKRFEALLARDPKNGPALLALAQLAAGNGAGKDEVAALLVKAVDANPTDAAPRLMLIDLYLRNKDNKQALAAAQSAVSVAPNSAEFLSALGRVHQVLGDVNQAFSTYAKLAALQPLSPQAHVLLADAQLANKDRSGAQQSLRKALELKPDQVEAQRRLIAMQVEDRNYTEATRMARTMQEQRPKSPVGFIIEGDVANAQRNWDVAALGYKAALQLDPVTEAATKLHAVLSASGRTVEANKFAAGWQREHPKDAVFLAFLAEQALARKDFVAAERLYLAALQLQPSSAVVLNNLAWVTGELRKDGALAYAEKANKLVPDQPAFMDTLAALLAAKGEYARAVELQGKAVAIQPENAGLRMNLAKIYIAAGDKAKAKEELQTLAKLGNKFTAQAEVQSLIGAL